MEIAERAVFKDEYLNGLRIHTRWYQRLHNITNMTLPVREQSASMSISLVR